MSYTGTMEILGKLFGSPARVKVMRLFLLNPDAGFEPSDVVRKAKISKSSARKELNLLKAAHFIRQKSFIKDIQLKDKVRKKRVKGWFLNDSFPQLEILKVLLVGSELMNNEEIGKRFRKAGKIKLLAVAGVFIQDKNSRVDLLLVGDKLKRNVVYSIIKDIEAEVGKELIYALFDTKEFIYRLNMYDKLIDDILSYPHERIIENREFSTLPLKKF